MGKYRHSQLFYILRNRKISVLYISISPHGLIKSDRSSGTDAAYDLPGTSGSLTDIYEIFFQFRVYINLLILLLIPS